MKQGRLTIGAQILLSIFAVVDFIPRPFESKSGYVKRLVENKKDYWSYYKALHSLEKRGLIKIYKDGGQRYIKLTQEGALETLFVKAKITQEEKWDGKWRMIIFDIPEDARAERNKLRRLLETNGFKQVQKSVYINPYALSRDAVKYLHETGLYKYIRIFRIDDVDDDSGLKKLFSL